MLFLMMLSVNFRPVSIPDFYGSILLYFNNHVLMICVCECKYIISISPISNGKYSKWWLMIF